jgi:radical SAM superfamily enzyme YgiQ (UPF0313 family)
MNKSHLSRICDLIIEKDINCSWGCSGRADQLNDELIQLMKKAGCTGINIGVESANDAILKNINKSETIEMIRNGIDRVTRNGLGCGLMFIIGLPGETKETIKNTIDFACDVNGVSANFTLLNIMPGCALWDELKGQYKTDFSDGLSTVTWVPPGLTEKDLYQGLSYAFKRFYLYRPKYLFKYLKGLRPSYFKYFIRGIIEKGLLKY